MKCRDRKPNIILLYRYHEHGFIHATVGNSSHMTWKQSLISDIFGLFDKGVFQSCLNATETHPVPSINAVYWLLEALFARLNHKLLTGAHMFLVFEIFFKCVFSKS